MSKKACKPKRAGALERALDELQGQICWGAEYDRQLNLSISFGEPSLEIVREPHSSPIESQSASRRIMSVKGRWWLWVFQAYWKLTVDGLVASMSRSWRRNAMATARLAGERLSNVEINPSTGKTRFCFDLGATLDVWRFSADSDNELWTLYRPTGYVLCVYGDGSYAHVRASTGDDENRSGRRPIPEM